MTPTIDIDAIEKDAREMVDEGNGNRDLLTAHGALALCARLREADTRNKCDDKVIRDQLDSLEAKRETVRALMVRAETAEQERDKYRGHCLEWVADESQWQDTPESVQDELVRLRASDRELTVISLALIEAFGADEWPHGDQFASAVQALIEERDTAITLCDEMGRDYSNCESECGALRDDIHRLREAIGHVLAMDGYALQGEPGPDLHALTAAFQNAEEALDTPEAERDRDAPTEDTDEGGETMSRVLIAWEQVLALGGQVEGDPREGELDCGFCPFDDPSTLQERDACRGCLDEQQPFAVLPESGALVLRVLWRHLGGKELNSMQVPDFYRAAHADEDEESWWLEVPQWAPIRVGRQDIENREEALAAIVAAEAGKVNDGE